MCVRSWRTVVCSGSSSSIPRSTACYGDNAPILRTLTEAVYDLIEHDSAEQSTAMWPEDKTAS
jgi:hypothetical protein